MLIAVIHAGFFIACVSQAIKASESSSNDTFELTGTGVLKLEQPVQTNSDFQLKARLDAIDVKRTSRKTDSKFLLFANATAETLVCYSDTIFRDDFDGDGS